MQLNEEQEFMLRAKATRLRNNIKSRCYNINHNSYKSYGAKGVRMCNEWFDSIDYFVKDIKEIEGFDYEKFINGDLQLDKDMKQVGIVNKIYSKDTCMFISQEDNIEFQDLGKTFYVVDPYGNISKEKSIKKYCKEHNLVYSHATRMWNGEKVRKTVKGYQFFKEKPKNEDILKSRQYKAVSPLGEEIIFYRYNSLESIGHSSGKVRSAIINNKLTKDGWKFTMVRDGYRLTKKQEEDLIDISN